MTWAARIPTLAGLRYPQASFVLDFASNYYRGSGAQGSSPSALPGYNFTRALAAYAEDTAGNLIQFASGAPRITNKGVLIEESRTNLMRYSGTPGSWWSGIGFTSTNNAVGPDGVANSAATVTQTGASGSDSRAQQNIVVANNSQDYTCSWYAPKLTSAPTAYPAFVASLTGGSAVSATLTLDPVSGNYAATSASVSVQSSGNYWRVSIAITNNSSGNTTLAFMFYPSYAATVTTTRNTVTGVSNIVAFCQAEAGSFPTSYIPTTSASVTRPADVFYYTYSPGSAGTMAVAFLRAAAGTGTKGLSALNDGTGNNRMDLRDFGSSHNFSSFGTVSGVGQWSLFGGSGSDNTVGVEALSFASNAVTGAMNGSIIATTASASIPSVSRLYIGSVDNGVSQANQYIQRLAIYPFATSDAQLQSISSGNF